MNSDRFSPILYTRLLPTAHITCCRQLSYITIINLELSRARQVNSGTLSSTLICSLIKFLRGFITTPEPESTLVHCHQKSCVPNSTLVRSRQLSSTHVVPPTPMRLNKPRILSSFFVCRRQFVVVRLHQLLNAVINSNWR